MSFFEQLQADGNIDLRDARGRHHNLPLILLEFTLALLCNRDGNMSSIHRHMKVHHGEVCRFLGMSDDVPQKR